jgi:hypothetical protein
MLINEETDYYKTSADVDEWEEAVTDKVATIDMELAGIDRQVVEYVTAEGFPIRSDLMALRRARQGDKQELKHLVDTVKSELGRLRDAKDAIVAYANSDRKCAVDEMYETNEKMVKAQADYAERKRQLNSVLHDLRRALYGPLAKLDGSGYIVTPVDVMGKVREIEKSGRYPSGIPTDIILSAFRVESHPAVRKTLDKLMWSGDLVTMCGERWKVVNGGRPLYDENGTIILE